MRLTILGSGTCEMRSAHSSPAFLLQAGSQTVMLDMGQGALRQAMLCGVNISDIDMICLTHHHLDHMADLLPLLFALRYDPNLSRQARITLLARNNFKQILDGLAGVYGPWIDPDSDTLEKIFLQPGQTYEKDGLTIKTAEAEHITTSLAYRFEFRGQSLVYPGDTAACETVLKLARGGDLLIANCAGSDDAPKAGHLFPASAGRLAADARVKGMLLSHLYSTVDRNRALEMVKCRFSGPVWLAEDFMTLDLDDDGMRPGRISPAL